MLIDFHIRRVGLLHQFLNGQIIENSQLTPSITGPRRRHWPMHENPAVAAPVHAVVGRRSSTLLNLDAVEPSPSATFTLRCDDTATHACCRAAALRHNGTSLSRLAAITVRRNGGISPFKPLRLA